MMNIKLNYLWNFFVFFIFVYYFNELYKKRSVVIHTSSNEKLSQNPSILFCVSLIKNCKNSFKENGDFRNTKNKFKMMDNFICHINKNIPKNPKYIIEEAIKWNFFDAFERNKEKTVDKDIFLYDYHLCANFDLVLNFSQNIHNLKFSMNNIISKIYLYPASKFEFFLGEELVNFNDNENKKYISSLIIKQMIIFRSNEEKTCLIEDRASRPYKCSKIFCYQSCYKNKINSYRFLFTKDDDFLFKVDNETTNPVDHDCFNECHKSFYGSFYYIERAKYEKKKFRYVEFIFDYNVRKVIPEYLTRKEFFFLEIMSLLGVLLSFNFFDFLKNCLIDCFKLLKLDKILFFRKLKILILLFVNFCLVLNCLKMNRIYKNFLLINTTTSYLPINNEPFSFSPCFDVKTIFLKNMQESFDKNIFFLEQNTLSFKQIFNQSYVKFISRSQNVIINDKKVKLFFLSDWTFNNTKLTIYKCFIIHLDVNLSLIQNLLENSIIEFIFNRPISFYFLTSKDFLPNSETFKIYPGNFFKLFKTALHGDPSIFNCTKYQDKCFSQRECIDKCIISNYINEYFKLPSNIPIFYNPNEKKWLYSLSFNTQKSKNSFQLEEMYNYCLNTYFLIDCDKKIYKPFSSIPKGKKNHVKMFLKEYVDTDSKLIFFNKYEFISKILTSINVWLGLTIPNLFKNFIFQINKKIFLNFNFQSIKRSKYFKSFHLFINLLIFLGLINSLYLFSNEFIKKRKITSMKYRFLTEIKYPYIIICIDFEEKIKLKKNLTINGNLLDKLTFSSNDVFESIVYLNENLILQKQTNFNHFNNSKTHNILQLSHFYLMNYKCYKLKYKKNISYYHHLRKKDDLDFLTINLKNSIKEYFLVLESDTSTSYRRFMKMSNQNNIVYFFRVSVQYIDLYAFLRDPTYFFKSKTEVNFNEAKSYMNFLRKKFKESRNKSTLLLPLEQKYFNLTIDDNEFLEFYETEMVKLEKQNVDKNYFKVYFNSIIFHSKLIEKNQLKLKPKFLTYETVITDKVPIGNFFLSFLNIFSFWFNISLINIFQEIKSLLKFICRNIIKK